MQLRLPAGAIRAQLMSIYAESARGIGRTMAAYRQNVTNPNPRPRDTHP